MPRSRLLRASFLLILMAGVIYFAVSLYLPSPRKLIFGVDKRSGHVRMVDQHVTFLPPHQFYRLVFEKRGDSAQRDGLVRIQSAENVPVTVNYRLRFGVTGDRLPDPGTMVAQGFSAWIGKRVAEAVDTVTRRVPVEELLAPTSSFNRKREPLRQTVARHLANSGLRVTAFEIERLDVDRDALLQLKRAELRRRTRGVIGRVAIFALEGADWELLSELADDDRIPHIKALNHDGVAGSVQTIQPTVAPMLWTSVATGLPPDRHGVIDFIDHGRGDLPVDAFTRRTPALWEIAEAFSRHSLVVNWWCDWPRAADSSVRYDTPGQLLYGEVAPSELAPRLRPFEVPLSAVGYEQVRRFLNISAAEYQDAVSSGQPGHPVNELRSILAKTWNDHQAALHLYREQAPTLFMMDFDGTDAVNHLFAPFHPPQRDEVRDNDYRKYWPAVSNYYAEVDRLLGEWMSILPQDTTIILLSSHGFRWGKNRPRSMPNGAAALSDHRNPGIFIACGNHVVASRSPHTLSVYDIAPTVLAILGLPQATEMAGHVATWAFADVTPIQSMGVVSYSDLVNNRPLPSSPPASDDSSGYRAGLRAIGHLNDSSHSLSPVLDSDEPVRTVPPIPVERWGRYAYWNNQGVQLRSQGKTSEAINAFDRAIDINPTQPTPYLNEAMTAAEKQQYGLADRMFLKALELGLPEGEQWLVDFAAFYRDRNVAARAITLLYAGKKMFPQSYRIAANLGAYLIAARRYSDGVPELEHALGLQPSSTAVLDNLGIAYANEGDYARALDFWNRSLAIDPRQPEIREAVVAARTRL